MCSVRSGQHQVDVSCRLAVFDSVRPPEPRELADLHTRLLPFSPLALLGPIFMEKFYYRVLPRADLIFGGTAYVDDRPVGFIVATSDSSGFMPVAIRRYWARLVGVLVLSLLRSPGRLGAALEGWNVLRNLEPAQRDHRVGELLSLGVLPEYRTGRFLVEAGLRIPTGLLDLAVEQMRQRGVELIRAIVDEDNLQARFFYHGAGWKPGAASVPGWRKQAVEFLWQMEGSRGGKPPGDS